MDGFGSGRAKTAHLTTECVQLDTMQLRKHGYLDGKKDTIGTKASYRTTDALHE